MGSGARNPLAIRWIIACDPGGRSFWTEYYVYRGKDCLSLEFSSSIHFSRWRATVAALTALLAPFHPDPPPASPPAPAPAPAASPPPAAIHA